MTWLKHSHESKSLTPDLPAAGSRRPRILVMAYACEPGKGSEPGVGWNWSLQLSRFADVVVVTRSNNRDAIESMYPSGLGDNLRVVYYEAPEWVRCFKRGQKGLYPYYFAWQLGASRVARRLQAAEPFDCALQLTFGSIWLPVLIHRLPVKFVWGPIGGGEGVPSNLLCEMKGRTRLLQSFRQLLKRSVIWNPLIRGPLRRADLVLVRTRDTAAIIPDTYRQKCELMLETGISPEILEDLTPAPRAPSREPVALFTGRLIGFKNVEMLLHALRLALDRGARLNLRIVGDGPEAPRLHALARELDLADSVAFVGAVPYETVMDELRKADIYAFPSLREAGVWSLIEAMCAALPVVCVDTSGMQVIADSKSAILVSPISRNSIIEGFAKALEELSASPMRRTEVGSAARERMQNQFLWDRKGEALWDLMTAHVPELAP